MSCDAYLKDFYRYHGTTRETLKQRLFRPPELQYLYCFRKLQTRLPGPLHCYWKFRLRMLSRRTHIKILEKTRIGEGFYIGHTGRVIINPGAVLGRNVNIATGVTIGREVRGAREGCPTIGDNCWIGTNAVIVGKITIGSDVLIAPLTYVNFDVPDHSIVIGNPGRIIPRENATEAYIQNPL